MGRHIDYFGTLNSPWTWMGHARLMAMAGDAGATVRFHAVNYGEIFPVTGGLPLPKRAPARQAYRMQELKRWRAHHGLPLNLEPAFFPADETQAAHLVIAARETGGDACGLAERFMRAVWSEERNIADPATVRAIVQEAGMDPDELAAAADRIDAAAIRSADTKMAIERGVFGAPTYILDDEMFWGQDRLDFVAERLG